MGVLPLEALTTGSVHVSTCVLLLLTDYIYVYPYDEKEPLVNTDHYEYLCNKTMEINV